MDGWSSEEDDLLRLASNDLRKKLEARSSSSEKKHEVYRTKTLSEKRTESLKHAHRRVQKVSGTRKKEDERLKETIAAISAQEESLLSDELEESAKKEPDQEVVVPSNEVSGHVIQSLLKAPKSVQVAFVRGQKLLKAQKWEEAANEWLKVSEEEGEWTGDVWGRIGYAYQRRGRIQVALDAYQKVVNNKENRKELLIDVLNNMSGAYRDIGAMEKAMTSSTKAKEILASMVSPPSTQNISNEALGLAEILYKSMEGDFSNLTLIMKSRGSDVASYIDDATGVTFFMAAAGQGNTALLNDLLLLDAKLLDYRDIKGHQALAWAYKFGHVEAASLLLDSGAKFSNFDSLELKSWPQQSLEALKAHVSVLKVGKNREPKPYASNTPSSTGQVKKSWSKPLIKGQGDIVSVDKKAKASGATQENLNHGPKSLPKGFHAAPTSMNAVSGKLYGRALAKWEDPNSVLAVNSEISDLNISNSEEWDQFEANKRLFGVSSNFIEEKYTTSLVQENLTEAQRERAESLAREIASLSGTNTHQAEERGQVVSDQDYDEEAKYSAVVRNASNEDLKPADKFTDSGILN